MVESRQAALNAETSILDAGNSRRPSIPNRFHLRNEHTACDLARRWPTSYDHCRRRVVVWSIERIL